VKEHEAAISQVTSRGADFEAFREFMKVRAALDAPLSKESTKPRWARLLRILYFGKQRAFANFFNELSALKEDKSQRLVVAYRAGHWMTRKGSTPAPSTRAYKECTQCLVTMSIDGFRTSYTSIMSWGVYLRVSRWKSASRALRM
jgi:hypothetical protein